MDADVAIAIDGEAVLCSIARRIGDSYNADGEGVASYAGPAPIYAAVQPATGRQLMDVPEGVREEARWLAWSRDAMANDDRMTIADGEHRIVYVWPRADGGYYKAALGRIKQ